jgi:hypothetical protein
METTGGAVAAQDRPKSIEQEAKRQVGGNFWLEIR